MTEARGRALVALVCVDSRRIDGSIGGRSVPQACGSAGAGEMKGAAVGGWWPTREMERRVLGYTGVGTGVNLICFCNSSFIQREAKLAYDSLNRWPRPFHIRSRLKSGSDELWRYVDRVLTIGPRNGLILSYSRVGSKKQ